jgi:predicted HNH restriction endonuclease
MSDYPQQWKELAKSIKEKSDWRCNKCGRACLRPGDKSITDKRRAYNLQVHHWDRNPSNNKIENLICLCSACHLSYHKGGKGNISPGQLSLFDGLKL